MQVASPLIPPVPQNASEDAKVTRPYDSGGRSGQPDSHWDGGRRGHGEHTETTSAIGRSRRSVARDGGDGTSANYASHRNNDSAGQRAHRRVGLASAY